MPNYKIFKRSRCTIYLYKKSIYHFLTSRSNLALSLGSVLVSIIFFTLSLYESSVCSANFWSYKSLKSLWALCNGTLLLILILCFLVAALLYFFYWLYMAGNIYITLSLRIIYTLPGYLMRFEVSLSDLFCKMLPIYLRNSQKSILFSSLIFMSGYDAILV